MNCKNCQHPLEADAHFCEECGAQVIKNRITFKFLITELFTNVFGLDSKFFITFRKMITHPDDVLGEYLSGVRKRYVNPFAFLAVAAALSLIVYNFFAEDYLTIQASANAEQVEEIRKMAETDLTQLKNISEQEMLKLKTKKQVAQMQLDSMDSMMNFMLRYFNLAMFLFLPFYATLSKWTYPKPHNFGEHIIMNAYIYGFATFFSLLMFFLSMLIHPKIYFTSMLLYIVYYLYVFGKLYNHSIGKSLIKLLRFLIGLAVVFLVLVGIGIVVGIILAIFGFIDLNPQPKTAEIATTLLQNFG